MSHLLWQSFWENDVDKFQRLLASTSQVSQTSKSTVSGNDGTSPRSVTKSRGTYVHGYPSSSSKTRELPAIVGRLEVNSRDHAGLTLLLRAASSTEPHAIQFVEALVNHPTIDLYVQDPESGWNALHRSLYAGNVSVARVLLQKERENLLAHNIGSVSKVGRLIKTKDHEGKSPFDLYNSTITAREPRVYRSSQTIENDTDSDGDDNEATELVAKPAGKRLPLLQGDEVYVFGSNRNLSLGVGDAGDRQYPDRIHLTRSDNLLLKNYEQHCINHGLDVPDSSFNLNDIPIMVRERPIIINDVVMSKLHTAVLTEDSVSNLHVCGVGRGGRLGLGDENTRFKFVPVQGPLVDKKVLQIALGLNHTLAVTENGELWSWGLNTDSQLGYVLPPPAKADEEPMCVTPRQVFGPLKKEIVVGIAASAIHSVAFTGSPSGSYLYCWGRNVGQLGLMDSDSRSLDFQQTPRKVVTSILTAPIKMVSAIDKATSCLLENNTVWVFTNYGYKRVTISDTWPGFSINTSHSTYQRKSRKDFNFITSGGDTIAATTPFGDLFTVQLNQNCESIQPATSTTNPTKIKGALTQPQCIWESKNDGVVSVNVGEHGSVIICTESGAVWKRVKRSKSKAAALSGNSDYKLKGFKFERIPFMTECVGVRSSTFGAFSTIRGDSKAMHDIGIQKSTLWEDIRPLSPLSGFEQSQNSQKDLDMNSPQAILDALLTNDPETDLIPWLQANSSSQGEYNMEICTSSEPEIKIPVHSWMLSARSTTIRAALSCYRKRGIIPDSELFAVETIGQKIVMKFFNIDFLTLLNLLTYVYMDSSIPFWDYAKKSPIHAYRYRQVRIEVMRVANSLHMPKLEAAARTQGETSPTLDSDMGQALSDPTFFEDADMVLELDGAEIPAHSQMLCQRSPFFQTLFYGRSEGQWLSHRRNGSAEDRIRVDLKHLSPVTFEFVFAHIYGDTGPELFDTVVTSTLDEFSEVVLDVMAVADELMLDRLSQLCQFTIAKFVTTRNISTLLNEISPCMVADFKQTGLKYVCLQLETMLENHLLDDLDEDLLQELDEVARDNQLAQLPFSKSGRATLLLHEKYPDLADDIQEERKIMIKALAYKALPKAEEKKLSSSYKTRVGSLDNSASPSPSAENSNRRASYNKNEPSSPTLRSKSSVTDMIFDMDEEIDSSVLAPFSLNLGRQSNGKGRVTQNSVATYQNLGSTPPSLKSVGPSFPKPLDETDNQIKAPWSRSQLPSSKLDLKNIMSESIPQSELVPQKEKDKGITNSFHITKLSQKERKKLLQQQVEAEAATEEVKSIPWQKVPEGGKVPPWKATAVTKSSLKDTMASESSTQPIRPTAKPLQTGEVQPISSPDTKFPGQGRSNSSANVSSSSVAQQKSKPLVPYSKTYITPTPKFEEEVGASMADIIGQQRREQQIIKEAMAKRSLQEIQQEQEFQQWWDEESRRTQEEEARRQETAKKQDEKFGQRGRRGGGRGGSRGGKTKRASQSASNTAMNDRSANTDAAVGRDGQATKQTKQNNTVIDIQSKRGESTKRKVGGESSTKDKQDGRASTVAGRGKSSGSRGRGRGRGRGCKTEGS